MSKSLTLTSVYLRPWDPCPTAAYAQTSLTKQPRCASGTYASDKKQGRRYLHIYSRFSPSQDLRIFHSNYISITDDERLSILNWLSDVSFKKHHDFYKSLRSDGTGGWLLAKDSFRNWNDSDSSALLWLHGIGKRVHPWFLSRTEADIWWH